MPDEAFYLLTLGRTTPKSTTVATNLLRLSSQEPTGFTPEVFTSYFQRHHIPEIPVNKIPCGKCEFFDGNSMVKYGRPTKLGWCAALSKYPATDPIDRPAPRGARRVPDGELAQPVIKSRAQVETGCTWARPAEEKKPITREALLAKAQGKR